VPTEGLDYHNASDVSEQILNGTSAQIGYTVPLTSVLAGKYGEKTNRKQTLLKLSTTKKKANNPNTAKQNCPGSVAFYDTRSGNEVGLFYNAPRANMGHYHSADDVRFTFSLIENVEFLVSPSIPITRGLFLPSLASAVPYATRVATC